MAHTQNPEDYIIPQGLNFPKMLLLWTLPEWIMMGSIFLCFMLINEVGMGFLAWGALLWVFHNLKQTHTERGQFQHFIWRASFPDKKERLGFAPDPAITRFDG
jgi:hypothetical protein